MTPRGKEASTERRLWPDAPRSSIQPVASRRLRFTRPFALSAAPVAVLALRSAAGVPSKTICPPFSPAPGPSSITRSAPRIISRSCSTTTATFSSFDRARTTPRSRSTSRGCKPTVGSSSTNIAPFSVAPSALVSATRWVSPPESVREVRSKERYPRPTSCSARSRPRASRQSKPAPASPVNRASCFSRNESALDAGRA